jgi:hypothetical protein
MSAERLQRYSPVHAGRLVDAAKADASGKVVLD